MHNVIAWFVGLMSVVSPPDRTQYVKEAMETVEEAQKRYEDIARDAMEVAFDKNEDPVFSGDGARVKTMATLLAIASHESAFRRDVDFGLGKLSRGDGGQSYCLNQVRLSTMDSSGRTYVRVVLTDGGGYRYSGDMNEGWGGEDLVSDRKKCFRTSLAIIRNSFDKCRYLPEQERLRAYASGSCRIGSVASRTRMGLADKWFKSAEFDDSGAYEFINSNKVAVKIIDL